MKKKIWALLGVFVFVSIIPVVAFAELKVDRVWSERDYGFALVTFTNDSDKTLKRVMVQCIALGKAGNKLNENTWMLFPNQDSPIKPGAKDTQKVIVPLAGGKMHSMSCQAQIKHP